VNKTVREIHARLLRESERARGILFSFEKEREILGSFQRKCRDRETESCYSPLRERDARLLRQRERKRERC